MYVDLDQIRKISVNSSGYSDFKFDLFFLLLEFTASSLAQMVANLWPIVRRIFLHLLLLLLLLSVLLPVEGHVLSCVIMEDGIV